MAGDGVEIVRSALTRAWRRAEYEEIWLQFRCREAGVLADVEAAVEVANTTVDEAGWGGEVFAQAVSESEAGPVALMSRAGPEEGVWAWFEAFAAHLQDCGRTGKVTAAPQVYLPDWLSGATPLPPQPTAYLSYTRVDLPGLNEQQRRARWNLEPAVTREITDAAVGWARFRPADVYLSRDLHQIRTRNPDVSAPLADGVIKFGMAGVIYVDTPHRALVSAMFASPSETVYQRMHPEQPSIPRVAALREILTALPEHTDVGFIKHAYFPASSWQNLSNALPPMPHIRESHLRYNPHLTTEFVPDAHGIQLLTPHHLDRARSLDDWTVTELPGDRYLVEAADLDAWYAQPEPDPEVLAAARADFGDMILTPEAVSSNPPPW